jgi:uncharacterized protein
MTPLLLLFFGVSPIAALATDLWSAVITKLVGAGIHGHAGQVDWPVVPRLRMGSLPMALLAVVSISMGSLLSKNLRTWNSNRIGHCPHGGRT